MGFMDQFWGRIKIKSLECSKLYLPNDSGKPTLVEATADDLNSLTPSGVGDGTITNTKLATDVKVGSLALLTTTQKSSVQAAINEVDGNIGALSGLSTTAKNSIVAAINEADASANAAYVKPVDGIPSGDLTAAVQTSLGKADTALQASIGRVVAGVIQLNGWAKNPVVFGSATNAAITGINTAVDFTTLGSGGDGATLKLTIDSVAEDTATLNCAQGFHSGGTGASTDMTTAVDTKFMISVDGAAAVEVTCDWTLCNSGAAIATQLQTAIRAATGGQETVTFEGTNHYHVVSATYGTGSSILITNADSLDCCDELQIGEDYGSETQGTGDCVDSTAVTPDEIATLINGDIAGCTASVEGGILTITSDTSGRGSRVLAGNGTANTLCGIPNNEVSYGAQSLSELTDWADADYQVLLTYKGTGAAGKDLGWDTPATGGFNVTCETTSDTGYVSVLVVG